MEELNNYEFWMAESMLIDNRMQYVINFRPKVILMYALLYGKLYIDRERLSFTRIEMSLDMQDKSKATTAILYKKPLGLRFKPQELSYLVTYKDVDGKTYLNYISNTIRFKCDWKKKLFSTNYTVASEMVVTDKREGMLETIPNKEAFSLNQIFYDKVDEYWSPEGFCHFSLYCLNRKRKLRRYLDIFPPFQTMHLENPPSANRQLFKGSIYESLQFLILHLLMRIC